LTVSSRVNYGFDVIGITEHKIHEDTDAISNLDIPGYHPFLYDPITTSHGGAGLYINDSLVFTERKDLQFNSPGNHESIFVEVILPKKKNMIIGCIYRHPTSNLTIQEFNNVIMGPLLQKSLLKTKILL